MSRYLVCIDGSDAAKRALAKCLTLAGSGDTLWLVMARTPVSFDATDKAKAEAAFKKVFDEKMAPYLALVKSDGKPGVSVHSAHVDGDPRDALLDFAAKRQVDFIVCGSRGMGPVKRLILGSVSDFLLKHAECAVIVVK